MKKRFFILGLIFMCAVFASAQNLKTDTFYGIKFGTSEKSGVEHMLDTGWKLQNTKQYSDMNTGYTFTREGETYYGLEVKSVFIRFHADNFYWGSITFGPSVTEEDFYNVVNFFLSVNEDNTGSSEYSLSTGTYEEIWMGLCWDTMFDYTY